MKLRTLALAALVLVALALPVLAADAKSPMKPGKWQVTMTMDMPNMPMKMPPMTFTNCITKEQAENPQPPKKKGDEDCKLTDYKIDGNTVTWTVKCTGKTNATGDGKMTFAGDGNSYDGAVHLNMNNMDITQHFAGKYLGECDK